MHLPQRKQLPHTPPACIKGATFFITIACRPRGHNTLCSPRIAEATFAAAEYYSHLARWQVTLLLLMPDHAHLLACFPRAESMPKVVRAWKHYLAAKHQIPWQRDFFDHRLRSDESLDAKAEYIRQNPVRAGLVNCADAWPYFWPR